MLAKAAPRKVVLELKRKEKLNKKMVELENSMLGIHQKKRGIRFPRIEKKTPVLRPALQSNHSSLCSLRRAGAKGEED